MILDEVHDRFRTHPKLIIAEDYELAVQRVLRHVTRFRNGEKVQTRTEERHWTGLRLLHRRQAGTSATSSVSNENLKWLVDSAFVAAEQSGVDPYFRFPLWKGSVKSSPELPASEKKSPESWFSQLALQPAIFDETYEELEIETKLFRKKEKAQPYYQKRQYLASFGLKTLTAERQFWLKAAQGYDDGFKDSVDCVERLLGLGISMTRAVEWKEEIPSKIIFSPAAMAVILREMMPWFASPLVLKGVSPLPRERDREKQVFSSAITIFDDGTLPGGVNTVPFDMEGTPSQKTLLVDKGCLRDLLYDSYHAAQDNRLSTGNYRRSLTANFPEVGVTHLYVSPSDKKVAGLVADAGDGLYLETIDGVDVPSGEPNQRMIFASGWRIKGGVCSQPVHSVDFVVDLPKLLGCAADVGNDLTVFGEVGSPSIFFSNLPIVK